MRVTGLEAIGTLGRNVKLYCLSEGQMNTQKYIWITGASSGIGHATALRLAKDGHIVFATARSQDKLKELKNKSKNWTGQIIPMAGDVTDPDKMADIVSRIETDHGPLDMVLLNAGTYIPEKLEDITIDSFSQQWDVNLNGVKNCLFPALEKFLERKKGHIAITASVAGFRGLPRSLAYGSSKAALINLAEALYMECKPKGIKVQVINPGFVKTPLTDQNRFKMPMRMAVEDAADALVKGLYSDQFEIVFPRTFVMIKKMIDLLPNKVYLWLIQKGTESKEI